ncbi:hypothetical protein [Rhodococcus tukisamuensis]|uniref:Uncharacterized protein n=1 Tax=Rhodococcus tukisamuensis TaxID=168276 RepID=A0A1G6TDL0_9NOCA|nr:hypothetical protein [Rhodococcus tukisamuensis]SDD26405.1 hypothetical protein SAMN05444580_103463 [Rhodococcus tukisamuensis]
MALNKNVTTEQIRDFIASDILPKAVAQWDDEKSKDADNEFTLRWVDGRVDAALQILQVLDAEAFDEWVETRNKQKDLYQ